MPTSIAPARASVTLIVNAWSMVWPSPYCLFVLTLFVLAGTGCEIQCLCPKSCHTRWGGCHCHAGNNACGTNHVCHSITSITAHSSLLQLVSMFQGKEGVHARPVCCLQAWTKGPQL
jgi:hypothetical protein